MEIFWRLILSHLLSDFTLQTDWVARAKRNSWRGMLVHSGTHLLLMLLLTAPWLKSDWVSLGGFTIKGWAAVLLIFAIHHGADFWRVFTISRLKTADGLLHFLWDRFIHVGVIFAFSPIVGFTRAGSLVPEPWVVLACLFVCVTHFSTVLLYYVEKRLYGQSFPPFDVKYMSMAQRLVLWLFFLLPGYHWVPVLILWGGYTEYLRRRRIVDFSRAGLYIGLALTVFFGVCARIVHLG